MLCWLMAAPLSELAAVMGGNKGIGFHVAQQLQAGVAVLGGFDSTVKKRGTAKRLYKKRPA